MAISKKFDNLFTEDVKVVTLKEVTTNPKKYAKMVAGKKRSATKHVYTSEALQSLARYSGKKPDITITNRKGEVYEVLQVDTNGSTMRVKRINLNRRSSFQDFASWKAKCREVLGS